MKKGSISHLFAKKRDLKSDLIPTSSITQFKEKEDEIENEVGNDELTQCLPMISKKENDKHLIKQNQRNSLKRNFFEPKQSTKTIISNRSSISSLTSSSSSSLVSPLSSFLKASTLVSSSSSTSSVNTTKGSVGLTLKKEDVVKTIHHDKDESSSSLKEVVEVIDIPSDVQITSVGLKSNQWTCEVCTLVNEEDIVLTTNKEGNSNTYGMFSPRKKSKKCCKACGNVNKRPKAATY